MCLLAIDLGGTKLGIGIFSREGELISEQKVLLGKRTGADVGQLVASKLAAILQSHDDKENNIHSIGVCVPGIYHKEHGTVWAPNISGWKNYPFLEELKAIVYNIPVNIDSDRSCYILGEWWKGAARGCTDAIYLGVGTGIGAGILADGKILRGSNNVAGAVGWMALEKPFDAQYEQCGCFESTASGEGIARLAKKLISANSEYNGILKERESDSISSFDVFDAYEKEDAVAKEVFAHCIRYWGMAVANLVSLFNPQKIILGGGVFGPAIKFIPAIYDEALKWAQPMSIKQVKLEASVLGAHAGLYGAAYLAKQSMDEIATHEK